MPRPLYPQGKFFRFKMSRRLSALKGWSRHFGKEKIFPYRKSYYSFIVQPIAQSHNACTIPEEVFTFTSVRIVDLNPRLIPCNAGSGRALMKISQPKKDELREECRSLRIEKLNDLQPSTNRTCIKMIGAVWKLIIFTNMVNRIINISRNERVTLQFCIWVSVHHKSIIQ